MVEQAEMLTRGEDRRGVPPGVRRAAVLVLVALAVLASLLWRSDQGVRAREDRAITACRTAVVDASRETQTILGAVADYLRPALGTLTRVRRQQLLRLMRRPARAVDVDVTAAARTCQEIALRPWHDAQRVRRDPVRRFALALLGQVHAVEADGAAWFRGGSRLVRLRRAAHLP